MLGVAEESLLIAPPEETDLICSPPPRLCQFTFPPSLQIIKDLERGLRF